MELKCTDIVSINMEKYLENYNNLQKNVVFCFCKSYGGIGDLTKFFTLILQFCIEHDIKLHYLITDSSVISYLKLKYENMYITSDKITESIDIKNIDELWTIPLNPNVYYIITPFACYLIPDIFTKITIPLNKIFYFSDDIKEYAKKLINHPSYISIHLRLGDKFLETDHAYVLCHNDVRIYDEEKLFNFIEQNKEKTILFFCDNKKYKFDIKQKYPFIVITELDIGHTSLLNTTEIQVFNTVIEFYLLTNSQQMYVASESGFGIMASKFNNIPLIK